MRTNGPDYRWRDIRRAIQAWAVDMKFHDVSDWHIEKLLAEIRKIMDKSSG